MAQKSTGMLFSTVHRLTLGQEEERPLRPPVPYKVLSTGDLVT